MRGMQSLPNDLKNMIMDDLMNELHAEARADEERYRNRYDNYIRNHQHHEDPMDPPSLQLVPYWFYDENNKKVTMSFKPLGNIDTINDGMPINPRYGMPINPLYRMPWKHPNFGLDKAQTFMYYESQAFSDRVDRNREEPPSNQELLDMLYSIGPPNIGGAMVNKKVKKCEKKVVLGKERCIYKVSGSKKDYMKYKGKLVPVSDYVKYMKKKN